MRAQNGKIQQRRIAVSSVDEPAQHARRQRDILFLAQVQHIACHRSASFRRYIISFYMKISVS